MEDVINKIKTLKGVKACTLITDSGPVKSQGLRVHTHPVVVPVDGENVYVPGMAFDIIFSQSSVYGAIKFVGQNVHPIVGHSIPSWGQGSIPIGDAYRMGDYHGLVFLILAALSQEPRTAFARAEGFKRANRLAPGWVVPK